MMLYNVISFLFESRASIFAFLEMSNDIIEDDFDLNMNIYINTYWEYIFSKFFV